MLCAVSHIEVATLTLNSNLTDVCHIPAPFFCFHVPDVNIQNTALSCTDTNDVSDVAMGASVAIRGVFLVAPFPSLKVKGLAIREYAI